MSQMLLTLRRICLEAGNAILSFYRAEANLNTQQKADDSPVTAADLAADKIICRELAKAFPDIPIVTEEQVAGHSNVPAKRYFLVDPLDGTKEFIQKRGEFTVNIALIDSGIPIAGVVYAPAKNWLFAGETDMEANNSPNAGRAWREDIMSNSFDSLATPQMRPIKVAQLDLKALRIVASKSHRDPTTDAYIAQYQPSMFKSAGSSLKFCLVAAGEADLYPRLGRTMEWDTAAGHAVLNAAGGAVVTLLSIPTAKPLTYGKAGFENPFFIAHAPGVTLLPLDKFTC